MEVVIGVGLGLSVAVMVVLVVPWAMSAIEPVFDAYVRYCDWVERRRPKRRRVDVTTFGDEQGRRVYR